jgi:hypothetical protein
MPFAIGPIEEFEKCFRDEHITLTDVLCDECFVEIKRSRVESTPRGGIAYRCGCYGRVFKEDNPLA